MSVNASKIDLIPFIEEVSSHFEDEATKKNIILSVDFSEKPIIIWGDPSMLEKIISKEDKASPLSDSQIVTNFNKNGIRVARRTVAKYREILAIPTSRNRKKRGI